MKCNRQIYILIKHESIILSQHYFFAQLQVADVSARD